jgi:hypothetical protein
VCVACVNSYRRLLLDNCVDNKDTNASFASNLEYMSCGIYDHNLDFWIHKSHRPPHIPSYKCHNRI